MRLRDVNWLGEGSIDQALCAGWQEVFVKVRSTRPPQPAWLSRTGEGIEVDLVAGEDGVSPGQACVFYDAAEGQARVLGGGFIQSAARHGHAARRIAEPASAADLKSLTHSRQDRVQGLQIESGTRIIGC
jgi:tRNA-specific 2-thiouridylase